MAASATSCWEDESSFGNESWFFFFFFINEVYFLREFEGVTTCLMAPTSLLNLPTLFSFTSIVYALGHSACAKRDDSGLRLQILAGSSVQNRKKCRKFNHFTYVWRQRPYHAETTGSHLNTEVKQRRAQLVPGWETAWEHWVLLTFSKLASVTIHIWYFFLASWIQQAFCLL